MVKAITLIKRKAGISREEFVKHYEEVHAPLALKHFSFRRYVRNHIIPSGVEEPAFDCITEVWFDDMAKYHVGINFWQSEAGQVIRDDEESFMDRSKMVYFLVEEKVSP